MSHMCKRIFRFELLLSSYWQKSNFHEIAPNFTYSQKSWFFKYNFLEQLLHPYKFYCTDMSGILRPIFASCEPFKRYFSVLKDIFLSMKQYWIHQVKLTYNFNVCMLYTHSHTNKMMHPYSDMNGCLKRLAQILCFKTTLKPQSCNTFGRMYRKQGNIEDILQRMVEGCWGRGRPPTARTDSIKKHTSLSTVAATRLTEDSARWQTLVKATAAPMDAIWLRIGRGDKLENFDLIFFPASKTWKGLLATN